ncbi:hypothetical protein D2T31_00540 [Sinirhodobacter populi]|uniref:DUF927 domain-containing protein n=1 Tax=Paenirhodobacter populi TaxID=2306993 RepID=A0A443KIB3_9RHOB|nr:hypothetical protein [Sinirhodobacter populi]RWR32505.1 hypothetical protein D2T31_00540 [Sinirhodobacter populi]
MAEGTASGVSDFNAEMERRKAAALEDLASRKRRLVEEGKALSRGASLEDLARELEEAPFAAGPDAGGEPPPGDPGPGDDPGRGEPSGSSAPPRGRKPARPKGEIWEHCPVRPLGVNGDFSYYLDRHGQLRAVKKHEAQTIMHLFGDKIRGLCINFPQFDREGNRKQGRFDQTSASMAMIEACSEKGLFNPDGAVRGVGAWKDDDGKLVYHCGQHLLTADGRKEPGDIQGKIYPAYPPIPEPAPEPGRDNVAEKVLDTLETWRWEHQGTTSMIALGMIGVQMLCGALDWRPVYWLTGDKAYGKSAFQDMLKLLHGGEKGLIQSNDPTKSGITSRLGHSSLPVAIDELEPGEEGSSKERDIIVLARVAASGGQWLRGSADQKGASGNVYSAFLFSSILIPGSMGPQDRSRLITLHLRPLDPSTPKLSLDPRTWRARGAVLKRLLIDRWPSWPERLELWRKALAEAGLSGRNGDNYATTMAMADMALHADMPSAEYLSGWARKVASCAVHETEEIGSDAESMLMHLMGQPFDVFRRGEMWTIAQWVMVAAALPSAPPALVANDVSGAEGMSIDDQTRTAAAKRANEKLAKVGMRVKGSGDSAMLFIANAPIPGLLKLFENSTWAKGVWAQSSRRIVGAEAVDQPLSLAGIRSRGVYVPLKQISGMLPHQPSQARAPEPAAVPMPDDWEEM